MSQSSSLNGQRDLTSGNMFTTLISFSLPFLVANLLQALYGAVDLWVVGKFGGGSSGVAAVANGGEVMHLVMSFVMGLTAGATVLIGQAYGASNKRMTRKSVGMTLTFSLVTGVAGTVVMVLISPWMVKMLNTPLEAFELAIEYLSICSYGVAFIVIFNCFAAIFRGFGNSTMPLICIGGACLCNIILDIILVAFFNMGVRGAAIATIISQGLSVLLSVIFFVRGDFGFRFAKANFQIVWNLVGKFIRIGVPIGVQSILINLSFLFIVSIVNKMSGDNSAASAGYGIVNRINAFTMLPAMSFAAAISALTAQNIGAQKFKRATDTLKMAVYITMLLGMVFLISMQCFPEFFIGLFIDRASAGADEVIRQGVLYARSFSVEYILVPIVFCTNGFFIGSGHSLFSMVINLASTFLFRVPVSYFVSLMAGATLFHIGFAAPLASFMSNIAALIFLFSGRWKKSVK